MRQDWEVKKLGDVCQIIGGGTPSKAKINFYNGNIPWATVRDMKWDIITETECTITEEGLKNSSTNIIPKNNVVIATRVGLGKVCLLKKDTAINQDLKGIIPLFSSELSVNYLYWWFKRISNTMIKNGKGATVQGVNVTFVKNLEIPIPTLTEQERIVEILDEALTGIATIKANTERNLKNARELFQSYLQSIFSNPGDDWEIKNLGEVCDFFNGFAFKSEDAIETSNTQLIRIGNLYQNKLDLERRSAYYPDHFCDTYKRYLLKQDDLIISLTGTAGKEDYGFTVKIPKTEKSLLLNQRVAKIIILNEKQITKDFLLYFLLSRFFLTQLYKTTHGTRQANLSTEKMKALPILIPDFLEQPEIVEKLDALSAETKKLEAIYQQKLNDLEELKKSLLQKAFNGELTNPEKS